jgi:hypothetical protein
VLASAAGGCACRLDVGTEIVIGVSILLDTIETHLLCAGAARVAAVHWWHAMAS